MYGQALVSLVYNEIYEVYQTLICSMLIYENDISIMILYNLHIINLKQRTISLYVERIMLFTRYLYQTRSLQLANVCHNKST